MRGDLSTFNVSARVMAIMHQIEYDKKSEGQERTGDHNRRIPKQASSQSSLSIYHISVQAVHWKRSALRGSIHRPHSVWEVLIH